MRKILKALFGKKVKTVVTTIKPREIDPVYRHASKFAKRSKILDASKMAERSDYLYPNFKY